VLYQQSNNWKKKLLSMSIGIPDCDNDITVEPYKSANCRRTFVPSLENVRI
jgi:hypothetical protein